MEEKKTTIREVSTAPGTLSSSPEMPLTSQSQTPHLPVVNMQESLDIDHFNGALKSQPVLDSEESMDVFEEAENAKVNITSGVEAEETKRSSRCPVKKPKRDSCPSHPSTTWQCAEDSDPAAAECYQPQPKSTVKHLLMAASNKLKHTVSSTLRERNSKVPHLAIETSASDTLLADQEVKDWTITEDSRSVSFAPGATNSEPQANRQSMDINDDDLAVDGTVTCHEADVVS